MTNEIFSTTWEVPHDICVLSIQLRPKYHAGGDQAFFAYLVFRETIDEPYFGVLLKNRHLLDRLPVFTPQVNFLETITGSHIRPDEPTITSRRIKIGHEYPVGVSLSHVIDCMLSVANMARCVLDGGRKNNE